MLAPGVPVRRRGTAAACPGQCLSEPRLRVSSSCSDSAREPTRRLGGVTVTKTGPFAGSASMTSDGGSAA
eukprot:2092078-Rhodomonas_salina.1